MIDDEIRNARAMIPLVGKVRRAARLDDGLGDRRNAVYLLGRISPSFWKRRSKLLMKRHRLDRPWIDPDYVFRFAGNPYGDSLRSRLQRPGGQFGAHSLKSRTTSDRIGSRPADFLDRLPGGRPPVGEADR
ncbi:MAG: hypothetical protein MZU84_05720 [Sphingobacterium sp.]|nr:hypothetical protein [Sphingobacterium sp.]